MAQPGLEKTVNTEGNGFLSLKDFKQKFLYGHRGHHFYSGIKLPTKFAGLISTEKFKEYFVVYAKDSKIPSNVMDAITLPYHGLNIALAKDKTTTGTITVNFWYDDDPGTCKLREIFEKWSEFVISVRESGENLRHFPFEYKGLLHTVQWGLNERIVSQWMYTGIWPLNVGEMTNAHDAGEILSYSVEFQYDWQYNVDISNVDLNFDPQA